MKQPRVLLTGAAGFVGGHLLEYLQKLGYEEIWGTTYSASPWLEKKLGKDRVLSLNLTDADAVFKAVEMTKPDWVIHLAALAFVGDSFNRATEVMNNNTTLQYVMLEAVRRFVPEARVLSIGSAAEYGSLPKKYDSSHINEEFPVFPDNPYAVSKLAQDYLALSYFLAYKLNVVRVRPFNQIGPRQTDQFAIPAFAKQIVRVERGEQEDIKVGNLTSVRDFTDVRDAVVVYELLMREGKAGEVYNLGSGRGVSMQQVLDVLVSLAKVPVRVFADPARFRPIDVPVFVADNQKIMQLGWQPQIPLEQSLKDVLEYERAL